MTISEELGRLGALRDSGVLTEEEFVRVKSRLLDAQDGPASASAAPPSNVPFVAGFNALRRSISDRWVGGVCGGLARATGMESWVWRLLFALLSLFGGFGVLIYLLLWIFVPTE